MTSRYFTSFFAVAVLFFLAGFVLYANSLDVPFYLDDFRNIVENKAVHPWVLSLESLARAAFGGPIVSRPVSYLTFALNYFLHGKSVSGYHLVNITLHSGTALLLFLLFKLTLTTPAIKGRYAGAAAAPLFAGLLWLVHPLHTGSVTYIVQRMVLLASFFYLLSLFLYVKGRFSPEGRRRWWCFAGSLVSGMLALGSKEIAATLPLVILLYEWFFIQNLEMRWLRKWGWTGVVFVLLSAAGLFIAAGSMDALLAGYAKRSFTPWERLLTETRVIFVYLGLLVVPHPSRLNLDHAISVSHSLLDPVTTLFSVLGILFLLALAVLTASKWRIFSFSLFWFLGNLVIESSFLGLELIFEHRTYLPSMFLVFFPVVFIFERFRPKLLAVVFCSVVILFGSLWTVQRNEMWSDPVRFWQDSAAKSPGKARPFMNLSVVLRERGEIDAAIAASRKAIANDPGFVNGLVGLGAAYAAKGELNLAEQAYQKALVQLPDFAQVYNALGVVNIKQGSIRKALAAFDECLRIEPENINALVNRASTLALMGRYDLAIGDFQHALELGGRNSDILFNLAIAFTRVGRVTEAMRTYKELLQHDPGDREARNNLDALLRQADR